MVYGFLIIFGLCLGSFINALVWRVHMSSEQGVASSKGNKTKIYPLPATRYSVLNGRSMCPNCKHELAAKDLVPVLSWLALRGRCRYCKKPISPQYPLVELVSTLVFVLSYLWWPQPLHSGQIVLFITWLACCVGLLALLVYDLKWMLLPNVILYPVFYVALAGQLVYLIGFEADKLHFLVNWLLSVAVASGIFWALYTISRGKWIGFGDVRLGLVTGTLLQTPAKSALMVFMASVIGTIIMVPLIVAGQRKVTAKIPYGPFLITATFICLLFGDSLLDWYKKFVGL